MPDRELELNSLERFRKQSRLVLEAFGHCEVPAGCGGVVLRWRDPADGIPLNFHVYSPAARTVRLDGVEPASSRPIVPFGTHVLAVILEQVDPGFTAFAFAATYQEKPAFQRPGTPVPLLTSQPDGTWRHVAEEPPDDRWLQPGYDDRAWPALTANEIRPPAPGTGWDRRSYEWKQLQGFGARGLGAVGSGRIWVRRVFILRPDAWIQPGEERGENP